MLLPNLSKCAGSFVRSTSIRRFCSATLGAGELKKTGAGSEPMVDPYAGVDVTKLVFDLDKGPAPDILPKLMPGQQYTVIWGGKRYKYPYRGMWEEEYDPKEWEELYRIGAIDERTGLVKLFKIKDKAQRRRIRSMIIEKDDGRPIWNKFYGDDNLRRFTYIVIILTMMLMPYGFYVLITPESENIFEPQNWVRWRKEAGH